MNPRTFVISLSGHEHSQIMTKECLESAKKFNWEVEIKEAVNGSRISETTWADEKIINKKLDIIPMNKHGVQGCFLSHWQLWNTCIEIDSPIIICEHDAVFLTEWDNTLLTNKLTKLHTEYPLNPEWKILHPEVGNWTPSAHAYIIYPKDCKRIKKFVLKNYPLPSDVLIGSNIVEFEHLETTVIDRNKNRLSTTENLNKTSR